MHESNLPVVMRRVLAAVLLTLTPAMATAQTYPTKSIRIVLPYPTGSSSNDIAIRALAPPLGEALGQTVVVDNKPGAGGNLGAEIVVRSAPDGYTLLAAANSTMAINPSVFPNLPYDSLRDIAPVAMVAKFPYIMVVYPGLPVKNVKELVAYARANPGKLNFSSGSGTGSTTHLCPELLKSLENIEMTHIPYKGSAQAMIDLVGGQVQVFCTGITSVISTLRAGKVRAIGSATLKRTELLPDLPTFLEQGIPDFDVGSWLGLFAPVKTPQPIIRRLNEEVGKLVRTPELKKVFLAQGAEPAPMTPEELGAYHRGEIAKWGALVRKLGIRPDS